MKKFIAIIIVLAFPVLAWAARDPMKYNEIRLCIKQDYILGIQAEQLEARRVAIDEKRLKLRAMEDEAAALRKSIDKMTSPADAEERSALIARYNAIVQEHANRLAAYEFLYSQYNTDLDAYKVRRASFWGECVEKRFYRLDLREACEKTLYTDTQFCKENLK